MSEVANLAVSQSSTARLALFIVSLLQATSIHPAAGTLSYGARSLHHPLVFHIMSHSSHLCADAGHQHPPCCRHVVLWRALEGHGQQVPGGRAPRARFWWVAQAA
eukprot:scaffold156929_cov23-Tisochrysis_lutea.AAC.1